MESQPKNPEFRNYPGNFHPWMTPLYHSPRSSVCVFFFNFCRLQSAFKRHILQVSKWSINYQDVSVKNLHQ